jgi:HrpA-like RNA helicase
MYCTLMLPSSVSCASYISLHGCFLLLFNSIDEVHERDMLTDFLLIVLKKLAERRKSIKLVLMSATVSAQTFANYFGGCAEVDIPGRAFPVQEFRLEDIFQQTGYLLKEGSEYAIKTSANKTNAGRPSKSTLRKRYPNYDKEVIHSLSIVDETVVNYELLADLVEHIILTTDGGAVLVFMSGMMEITKAIDEMRRKEMFQGDRIVVYPLHSSLSTSDQARVFDVPPEPVRKVVVSTNIAETSITIEDVVYVVDTGRVKENRRDEVKETPALLDCWVSRSSAKQRRGRSGRVCPGVSYHMFSR